MEIVKSLSLNKHPNSVPNLSLVNAKNIKITNDGACLVNDEKIITSSLMDIVSYPYSNMVIKGVIPCNNEFILFIYSESYKGKLVDIWRCREAIDDKNEDAKLVYSNLSYKGGEFIGTFTYNVENSLIIAFSEYGGEENVPLRTLNLGNFDDENVPNDRNLTESKLSLVPEIKVPTIIDYDYLEGNAYKGWYFCFIRYKINENNYTQWYNFGCPIYLNDLIVTQLYKEHFYTEQTGYYYNGYAYGCADAISDKKDICNKTFKIAYNDLDTTYSEYQLGFICYTKSYTKSWRTNDINTNINTFVIDSINLIEESVLELTTPYYNYFNVKNIINYKNKLYISNYKETEYDNIEYLKNYTNNINLKGTFTRINNALIEDIKDLPELNNSNFNGRCKNSTLIPDGIYNFFIHFVDKYGNATKGFKINKNCKVNVNGSYIDQNVYKLYIDKEDKKQIVYLPLNLNCTFENLAKLIDKDANEKLITVYENYSFNGQSYELSNPTDVDHIIIHNAFYNICFNYDNSKYKHLHVSQVINDSILNTDNSFEFGTTINSEGDILYRVPKESWYYDIKETYHIKYNIKIINKNNNFPKGYVGYYISYEEFEPNNIVTGLLVKRNANVGGGPRILDKNLYPDNDEINTSYFYSSYFDTSDKIKLNFNAVYVESHFEEKSNKYAIKNTLNKDKFVFPHGNIYYDLNIEETEKSENSKFNEHNKIIFDINYKLTVANDTLNNRFGKGTALQIFNLKHSEDNIFFENQIINKPALTSQPSNIDSYIISLYNYTNNIYINKTKKLIRLSDVIYNNSDIIINFGYNGCLTYEGVLVYNDNGFIIAGEYNAKNTIEGELKDIYNTKNFNKSITSITKVSYLKDKTVDVNYETTLECYAPVSYVRFPIYKEFYYESKQINNEPIIKFTNLSDITDDQLTRSAPSIFVEPINSIDLFKHTQGTIADFYPITSTNYIETDLDITEFNKTIRRSFIIQEETRTNNWRKFPIEEYKMITENKGDITNLVGIGNTFLIHTEHSLFQITNDNKLVTGTQDLQIDSQDIFDIDYKEVYTSSLGFGGLKDRKESIIDQFGYIFYDNDGKSFYRFDAGKLEKIDTNITDWIADIKPEFVRFAHDIDNNRILIYINYKRDKENPSTVISYNYSFKTFVSTHTNYFIEAYNTKNKLYMLNDERNSLYTFGKRMYGESKISIIVNEAYDVIKFIDQISYKLNKIVDSNNNPYKPITNNKVPFAGYKLRVYNDLTDTGELNITVNEEVSKNIFANFDKPYWYLGNWNYNYFRNNIANSKISDHMSRIIGNYFIIEFIFDGTENQIQFETLNYKLTK